MWLRYAKKPTHVELRQISYQNESSLAQPNRGPELLLLLANMLKIPRHRLESAFKVSEQVEPTGKYPLDPLHSGLSSTPTPGGAKESAMYRLFF